MWYSCWKPLNTKHKFVFKSNYEQKFNIERIFNNIVKVSKNFNEKTTWLKFGVHHSA